MMNRNAFASATQAHRSVVAIGARTRAAAWTRAAAYSTLRRVGALALGGAIGMGSAGGYAANIWLTPAGAPSGAPQTLMQSVYVPSGGTTTAALDVWALPDAGKTLEQLSLNVQSTNSAVLDFLGVDVLNPNLGVQDGSGKQRKRFEFTQDSASTLAVTPQVDPDRIDLFQGFTFIETATI
ncbi:MAG: hypothetical protein KDA61_08940, partial [Planctomycetales bacterium]|nr:hypothetical protein [Planctomycetales bacterium]